MPTPQSKYRFGPDTLEQIKWLKHSYELESDADAVRLAISRLYTDRYREIEKYLKNRGKPA